MPDAPVSIRKGASSRSLSRTSHHHQRPVLRERDAELAARATRDGRGRRARGVERLRSRAPPGRALAPVGLEAARGRAAGRPRSAASRCCGGTRPSSCEKCVDASRVGPPVDLALGARRAGEAGGEERRRPGGAHPYGIGWRRARLEAARSFASRTAARTAFHSEHPWKASVWFGDVTAADANCSPFPAERAGPLAEPLSKRLVKRGFARGSAALRPFGACPPVLAHGRAEWR